MSMWFLRGNVSKVRVIKSEKAEVLYRPLRRRQQSIMPAVHPDA